MEGQLPAHFKPFSSTPAAEASKLLHLCKGRLTMARSRSLSRDHRDRKRDRSKSPRDSRKEKRSRRSPSRDRRRSRSPRKGRDDRSPKRDSKKSRHSSPPKEHRRWSTWHLVKVPQAAHVVSESLPQNLADTQAMSQFVTLWLPQAQQNPQGQWQGGRRGACGSKGERNES